jgi:hypothetical protein
MHRSTQFVLSLTAFIAEPAGSALRPVAAQVVLDAHGFDQYIGFELRAIVEQSAFANGLARSRLIMALTCSIAAGVAICRRTDTWRNLSS